MSIDYQFTHVPLNRDKPKRGGKTPEALVSGAIDKYLDLLDFYVLRTSAGMATIDGRKIRIGRKGTHDRTCCAPNGRYVSIENKSADGEPTPDQLRQRAFILRRNGVVCIPHSKDELRDQLIAAFSLDTIVGWELMGKARQNELKKAKRSK